MFVKKVAYLNHDRNLNKLLTYILRGSRFTIVLVGQCLNYKKKAETVNNGLHVLLQLLRTNIYVKRDDFKFSILKFHLYVTRLQQDLYVQYISVDMAFQICWFLCWILYRGQLLTKKLLKQRYLPVKLKSYSHHHDLVNCSRKYVSQSTTDTFRLT